MKHNVLRWGCSVAGVVIVAGVFLFLYQALAPKPGGSGLASPTTSAGAPSIDDTVLGWYLKFRQADLGPASDSDGSPVPFSVVQGDLPANVAKRLQSQGLVRDSDLFLNLIKYQHAGANIQAGDYVLKRTMTMDEILEALQHGRARAISIIIRPGWRAEEIGEYLETLGLSSINKAQFLQAIKDGWISATFNQCWFNASPQAAKTVPGAADRRRSTLSPVIPVPEGCHFFPPSTVLKTAVPGSWLDQLPA